MSSKSSREPKIFSGICRGRYEDPSEDVSVHGLLYLALLSAVAYGFSSGDV